ncbi:MAG TPA: type II toxin-antitoxin system VapC family toxin [Vicinamibacterales bacterium]|nr:type II toxin-antitoxin system VapC family toxin [Vicinamibacterales bacterium]
MSAVAAAVADTHALIFHAIRSRRLGRRAAAHFDATELRQALTYVPAAVIWEVAFLAKTGRGDLRRPAREFFADLFSNPSYQPYDITPAQAFTAAELGFGRDPFDALVCAAAIGLELPLITRDTEIVASRAVRVIW